MFYVSKKEQGSDIIIGAVMLCGWEGNHGPGGKYAQITFVNALLFPDVILVFCNNCFHYCVYCSYCSRPTQHLRLSFVIYLIKRYHQTSNQLICLKHLINVIQCQTSC